MKIKKGFRIFVRSWENDGDNYRDVTLDGLSEGLVRAFMHVIGLVRVTDNIPADSYTEISGFNTSFKLFLDNNPSIKDETISENVEGILYDLGLSSDEFAVRVVEKVIIDYVPEELNFIDVTSEFMLEK